jgi:hypothetical protein
MHVAASSRLRYSTGYEQLPGSGSACASPHVGTPRTPASFTPHSSSGGAAAAQHSPYRTCTRSAALLLLVALGAAAMVLAWRWHVSSNVGSTAVTISIVTKLRQKAVHSIAAVPGQQQQLRASAPTTTTAAAAAALTGTQERIAEQICAHTVGDWCRTWLQQKVPAAPVQPLPLLGKPCPNNCSGIGNCDGALGVCYCPAGEASLHWHPGATSTCRA